MHKHHIKKRLPDTSSRSAAEPVVLANTRFHDITSFTASIEWDLDFRQLSTGKFTVDLLGIAGKSIQMLGVEFNRSFHQLGAPPAGVFTFAVPFLDTPEFRWCSGYARGGSLISFNLEQNYDAVVPPYAAVTFSIEEDRLRSLAEEAGLKWSLERLFRSHNHWRNCHSIRLAGDLEQLIRSVRSGGTRMGAYSEFLNEELPRRLLDVWLTDSPAAATSARNCSHPVVKRALEIINDHDRMPVRVNDLCALAECSPATLRRLFVSEFGVPPKVYLRSRCLSAVRDTLAKPGEDRSIAEVANDWGFWHMGQFAKDYRALFGELPSVTLNRH